jgi:hypothetical protein
MTPKIIELIIQDGDDEAGLDGIALVEMPAHEANFEYFNQEQETPCEDGKCSHYILADEQIPQVIQMFHAYGEPQGFLEKEGWEITAVKSVGKQEFQIISNPNLPSAQDTPDVRFRYKYVGPKDDLNRTFCAEMMDARRVFRIEDIMEMSNRSVNEVGPEGYSIMEYRGSYNCRHKWVQLMYQRTGRIVNNDRVETGVEDEDGMPGPDTRTTATIAAGNTPPRRGFTASNPDVSALSPYVEQIKKPVKKPVLASLPLFEKQEDAEAIAMLIGCEGSHEHSYGDKKLFMPCKAHPKDQTSYITDDDTDPDDVGGSDNPMDNYSLEESCWPGYVAYGTKIGDDGREVPNCVPEEMAMEMMKQEFQSYDDYPSSVRGNACKAIKWKEEHGDEVKGMTQVGWIRANQLCKGEKISEETIARMSGFQRHKKNSEVSPEFKDTPWKDKGYVAWLGWGGTTGINWAADKLKSIRNEMSFSVFSLEEKMVVGPAMVPDKMIIRRNEITGEIYYVYFTAETIKKLQQKFMLEKLLDKTNVEHGRRFLNGVSVVESWIVDDPSKDKQQVFGMDYPKGTWMISMKIEDDAIWNKVKEGKLNGFSVQGYFLEKAKFSKDNTTTLEEIKNILKQFV